MNKTIRNIYMRWCKIWEVTATTDKQHKIALNMINRMNDMYREHSEFSY